MLKHLKEIALELNSKDAKEYFINRINKIAEDLGSKDVLLIDIGDMESIFNPDKVIVEGVDESIGKITLDAKWFYFF